MKHLVVAVVTTLVGIAALPAVAATETLATFKLDENYVDTTSADELTMGAGEVDPNLVGVPMAVPAPVAAPVTPPVAAKTYTIESLPEPAADAELPEVVVVKPEAPAKPMKAAPVAKSVNAKPQPQEIPLIETKNEVRASPEVTYVTGGIGDDEQAEIQAKKAEYNLYVMSASKTGAFVGDARVVITRKNGKDTEEMLNVVAGPLLYVKLVDGSYSLDASLGEMKKHQNFIINSKRKTANVHLGWDVPTTISE